MNLQLIQITCADSRAGTWLEPVRGSVYLPGEGQTCLSHFPGTRYRGLFFARDGKTGRATFEHGL